MKKTWQQKQREYIEEKYQSSKKLAEEIWLNNNYKGTPNDLYYFECGFVAGLNYEYQQKRLQALQELNDLDQELGFN